MNSQWTSARDSYELQWWARRQRSIAIRACFIRLLPALFQGADKRPRERRGSDRWLSATRRP